MSKIIIKLNQRDDYRISWNEGMKQDLNKKLMFQKTIINRWLLLSWNIILTTSIEKVKYILKDTIDYNL